MSAEKLAFLQNFYTDVTLYVPAEPAAEAPVAAAPIAPAVAAQPALAPPPAPKPEPPAPTRTSSMPPMAYSKPSAGLERLTSSALHPVAAAGPPAPETPRPAPAASAVPPVMRTPFTVMGDNAQGVILLFRLPSDQFLKMHRNVFLNKMLQALSLVMADVLLVNVESDLPVALVNLRRELAATRIVAFGKNLLDTTIRNTQIYEPVQFPSLGLSYLASATVDLVEYDVSLKKRLWPGLQRMFLG
ncbi:hypothetical protein [Hymenobacter siberiensis]|jgi:hypothetical protein|uniref:hypothetical protein n=1 Tax=Hymenobacter siberiensis TaxID=2848396 RepID=UPI001C1E0186|nr:hypothetical protein [Hymenobacter siberiensis]MBU6121811.1 hypothetical protein [Hymenobacter siberiensis]